MTTTSTPLPGVATDVPLVLLPVRLETHFLRLDTGGTQLLVRIYPDDVHADSHEPRLTQPEIDWGQHFWRQTWLAGGNEPRMRTAWRQLAEQVGAPRAAYIADLLQPTNPGAKPSAPVETLTTQPAFPTLEPRPATWPRPPHTRVLPDSWIAIFYVGGQRFTHSGRAIAQPLALGPTLDENVGAFDAETIASDPNAGWLVDFAAAERVGMGLRIPYPASYDTPLQRLLVIGVRAFTGTDADGMARQEPLASLLRAHHYTLGLSFVAQGTPTNNTGEISSGYDSSGAALLGGPLAQAPEGAYASGDVSNRDLTARALGIPDSVLAGVPQSMATEQRDAYHMNAALWKATWGYFLEQLVASAESPSAAAIREGREHFSSYVRGRGPLPALRVGKQPYGLLPAISLDRWKPLESGVVNAPIVRALVGLREVWRRSVEAVPRVPGRPDPANQLVRVLAMQPTAIGYTMRTAQPLAPLGTTSTAGAMGSLAARRLAEALGIPWFPRQLRAVFSTYQRSSSVAGALVQTPVPELLSESDPLNPNYLSWLAGASWTAIRDEQIVPRPDALLYTLLRHSLLLDYVGAAARIVRRRVPGADVRLGADTYSATTGTPSMLLTTAVTDLTPGAVGAYLDAVKAQLLEAVRRKQWREASATGSVWALNTYELTATGVVASDLADDLREFAGFTRSASYLASLPTAALSRLLAETLDLASHRLDAWVTAFATKRLEWLRRRTPRGALMGGYGYVEDVAAVERALADTPSIPSDDPAPELAAPLYDSRSTQGYVQTPSLAHAATAAILRGGYLSRKASGEGNALAVNLSSERVRTALWLLEGVRSGQSLSVLLGYRFERGLHEGHPDLLLDRHIPTFRALAPQPGDLPAASPQGAVESICARQVADGLALVRRYRDASPASATPQWNATTIPFGSVVPPLTLALPPADSSNREFSALLAELRALDDAVDAMSDLAIAEAVHQTAQGNAVRAGAALDAIALGETPPPDLQVIETPRTGVALTHRLVVLFSGLPAVSWTATTPRSQAEPYLSAWASQLLGPKAAAALCRVTYVNAATGAPLLDSAQRPYRVDIALQQIGLGPLDVVYLPERDGDAAASELEQRVAYYAMQPSPTGVRPSPVTDGVGVRLSFAVQADWPAGTLSFAEVLEVAQTVRRIITSARALASGDLALAEATIPPTAEADIAPAGEASTSPERPLRLAFRADTAVTAFRAAAHSLIGAVPADAKTLIDPDTARSLLLRIAAFGLPGTTPISPAGRDSAATTAMHEQVRSVARELQDRLQRLKAVDEAYQAATATPAQTRAYHLGRMREVFGADFRVLPRFAAVDQTALAATFAASTALQKTNPLEAVTWLQRAARVRDGASRLDMALMYAEALGGSSSRLQVGQLPFQSGDVWVGLAAGVGATLGGRLSLVAHAPVPIDVTRPLTGLLVDEWVEVVPNPIETTGLAFHYNRPNARAPQAILLAVVPDDRTIWDVETLEATVTETLELAKLRTVDLSVLREVGQFLPALYVAQPPATHTITSDLMRLL